MNNYIDIFKPKQNGREVGLYAKYSVADREDQRRRTPIITPSIYSNNLANTYISAIPPAAMAQTAYNSPGAGSLRTGQYSSSKEQTGNILEGMAELKLPWV